MVLLKPALADLLLPHILADLARADADGQLARALSRPVSALARGRCAWLHCRIQIPSLCVNTTSCCGCLCEGLHQQRIS